MPVDFKSFVVRDYSGAWASWKAVQSSKMLVTQFDDDGNIYTIYGYDGSEVHVCIIWKGTVPSGGYTQDQNDTDKSDFETNYKPSANAPIESKTKDGRPQYKITFANRTMNFKKRSIYFQTASSSSLRNRDPNGSDYGDIVYFSYDVSGSLTTDPTLSVRTVLDWEPAASYEIIAGGADIDPTLKGGTTDQWWISAVGVPDYPPVYYGSVDYINETNLEMLANSNYIADGRAISFLANQTVSGYPHTNKMRFIIKHPQGESKRFQIYVEAYY